MLPIASPVFGGKETGEGALCFLAVPTQMLQVFTSDARVIEIGRIGFRFVGIRFLPMVASLIFPVFFQAIGATLKSPALTVIRTVVLFVPLGYVFSRFGLNWFWLTFPVTEVLTGAVGGIFYRQFLRNADARTADSLLPDDGAAVALKPSEPGVLLTIAREHGSSGKQIGRLVAQKLGIPFYYKEMVALAARENGLDREFISGIHKNAPDALRELCLSSHAVPRAVAAQDRIIRRIADNGSCVLVGRAADSVLRGRENLVRVFVRAPLAYRIARVMEVYGDTPREAKRNIRRSTGQERPITGTSRESAGEIRKTTSWWWIPRWGWRRRQRRFWSFSLPTAGRSRRKRRDGTSSRRKSNKKAGGSQPGEGSVLPASVLKKISGPRKERQRRLRAGGHPRRCRKWACRRGFRAEEQARFRFCTPA